MTSDVLGNGITESRTYSNDNLLTAINYSNASLGNLTYTWDTNKNKKSESIGGVMSGYGFTNAGTTYDDEDRLTGYQRTNGALSQSWNLTSVGDWNSVTTNGTAQSRTHGPTHELLTAGGQTVNTDVKGNITLLPAALSSLASTALGMSWDFDNKLKSVDVGNNSSTDVEYKYDALGRRVARVGSSGSFVYVQSDQQTIADYGVGDAPSSPLYRYVYASYIDEPVVRKGAGTGGTIHYYHRNQQYSVTAVTTSAGAIAERYAYSAYGEPTMLDGSGSVLSSSAINNRYTYTGREWDATAGLYHFRARWMSPKTGRFLGRDPIGYIGSLFNLVEYVDSNCLNNVDPSGLCPTPPECPDGKLKMTVCIRCDHGHCWIYTNDPNTGIEHTYGRWMNGYGGVNTSGVNVDVELKAGRGHTSERCTKTCSFNPRISTGYGFYGNNCATYASSIWLSVSGEHLNAVDWYGGDHPDQVCQSISCANGGLPTNCPGGICGPTGGGSSGSSGSSSGSSNGSSSCSSSGGGGSGSCSSIGCLGGSSGSSGGSSGSSGGFF